MIPSPKQCLHLMDKYHMPLHIRQHSFVVSQVASVIAKALWEQEDHISVRKTLAGALLHDIGKGMALQSGGDHAEIGRRICLENHLDEISEIVAEHVTLKDVRMDFSDISEKEVVYYSDKRVNHDRVVTLEERKAYILKRYGRKGPDLNLRIRENFEFCKRLEEKLFKRLRFHPEELAAKAGDFRQFLENKR